jgi:transcriptional regulator with XRE-family HTH domain
VDYNFRYRGMEEVMQNPQLTESVRTFLKERGLTQTELAKKTGLSVQYINNIYLGKAGSRVSVNTEQKLKKVMGKSFFLPLSSTKVENSIPGA